MHRILNAQDQALTQEESLAQEETLRKLHAEYGEKVRRYIRSKGIFGPEEDDVFQAVFEKIWKRLATYDPTRAGYATWVYTITRSCVTDYFRKLKPLVLNNDFEIASDSVESPEGEESDFAHLTDGSLEQLAYCLEVLDERSRDTVVLFYAKDMSARAIGDALGVKEAHVRVIKMRALNQLRVCMGVEES